MGINITCGPPITETTHTLNLLILTEYLEEWYLAHIPYNPSPLEIETRRILDLILNACHSSKGTSKSKLRGAFLVILYSPSPKGSKLDKLLKEIEEHIEVCLGWSD